MDQASRLSISQTQPKLLQMLRRQCCQMINTDQRILVSWISACWPPHQRNVQQVDRLAVGHRQTPNRSPMETGQNLSSQKIGLKVKKTVILIWFGWVCWLFESLKSSCSVDVPPAMEGDDAHVGGSRGLARHHRDQLLLRELCPPSAFSLRVLHEQQLHRILVAENNEDNSLISDWIKVFEVAL